MSGEVSICLITVIKCFELLTFSQCEVSTEALAQKFFIFLSFCYVLFAILLTHNKTRSVHIQDNSPDIAMPTT